MEGKIDRTIDYYCHKRKEILRSVNSNSNLTPDEIIEYGQEMAILEYKITALQIAMEN